MWRNAFLAISLVLFFCARNTESWRRRRRRRAPPPCSARNCAVSSWSSWGACSHQCGTSGSQRRTRTQTSPAACGGTCPYHFSETRACNRDKCQYGGTPHGSGCHCRTGYAGTCCERGKSLKLQNLPLATFFEEKRTGNRRARCDIPFIFIVII